MPALSRRISQTWPMAFALAMVGGLLGSCDQATTAGGSEAGAEAEGQSRSIAECGPVPASMQGGVRFARDVQPIFDDNCVACHQSGSAMMGLVLEQGLSHDHLVGRQAREAKMAFVEPGAPSRSFLLAKVMGTQDAATGGARMPLDGALDEGSIATLCRWIARGARAD